MTTKVVKLNNKEEMIDIDHNLEKHIHKQMGCMAGLFQIFDRNHFLSGKRIYNNTKRLPPVIHSSLSLLSFFFFFYLVSAD